MCLKGTAVVNSFLITTEAEGLFIYLFFKILFIYLSVRDWERKRERVGRGGAEGEGQADSVLSTEPDAGLGPTTLGSWPELGPGVRRLADWATQVPLKISWSLNFPKKVTN